MYSLVTLLAKDVVVLFQSLHFSTCKQYIVYKIICLWWMVTCLENRMYLFGYHDSSEF